MRRLDNPYRIRWLIDKAIDKFELNLNGLTVLTETASGPFVTTSLIAALAGAEKVYAVTADSLYGSSDDIRSYTYEWAEYMNIGERIQVETIPAWHLANEVDIITNLGFVRPIDTHFISHIGKAVVTLMCESWEVRPQDVDIPVLEQSNIPVLGVNEHDSRLQTFRYVGILALKLLLEKDIDINQSDIFLIGSGYFGDEISIALLNNGANVYRWDPLIGPYYVQANVSLALENADAIVIAEHQSSDAVLGGGGIPMHLIKPSTTIVHISGNIAQDEFTYYGLTKYPDRIVPPRVMTVTTDHVGPRPLIDLHAAGFKVGEEMARGMQLNQQPHLAIECALRLSPAMKIF